jgi:hypothetical protein
MSRSTIAHPALLGHANRFGREAGRISRAAAQPGLFDVPGVVDAAGGAGRAGGPVPAEALRTLQVLGEAYGMPRPALGEWMCLLAFGTLPAPAGPLLHGCSAVLPDLLLRAQTLALYRQAQGQGDGLLLALRAAAPLRSRRCPGNLAQLEGEIQRFAPHLRRALPSIRKAGGLGHNVGGLRDLRACLACMGLTGPGWRWLVRNQPYKVFDSADAATTPVEPQYWICQANWFGAVGPEFEPHPCLVDLLFDLMAEEDLHRLPLQRCHWLLQAAQDQCIRWTDDADELMYQVYFCIPPALMWVLTKGWRPDANQRRAGWPAIERAWRDACWPENGPNLRWAAPVACVELGGLTARALQTSRDMRAEARAMRNCLHDYVTRSACGVFQAYCVTQANGQRVAGLSIQREPGTRIWRAHDIKARFNKAVDDPALKRLLHRVVALANRPGGA